MSIADSLPTNLASAHALIIAQREALSAAQARATAAESEAQHRALLIEKLKYTIRKLRHERFGQSSERGALLDQLELQLADLEEDAAQAEAPAAAEKVIYTLIATAKLNDVDPQAWLADVLARLPDHPAKRI